MAPRDREDTAKGANLLAQDQNVRVRLHLGLQRCADRLGVFQLRHDVRALASNTRSIARP